MPSQKIIVGPVNKGFRNDVTPFNVDNDSFPRLVNAYQWRGRIKRRRGTSFLGRLQRYFDSLSTAYNPGTTTQVLSGGGAGNLLTGFSGSGIDSNASLVPGKVIINDVTTAVQYTDPSMDGTLSPGGTINYATGAFTISPAAADTVNASFVYYPSLPVMGLEQLILDPSANTAQIGFDTTYAYNIPINNPYTPYSVSFYKNPASSGSYTQKTTSTPVKWNGQNYQQFWTTNYQGALWATNGITQPFTTTNIGMQYKAITTVTVTSATTATLTINAHGLVVGDFVFVNEVLTTTGINFQSGYVTTVTDANNVVVTFPNATLATNGTGGIAQYLTSNADATKDGIRWYDGDPTTGSYPQTPTPGKGWVNFAPPLNNFPTNPTFSISDLPPAQYYLAGAKMIIAFKDRLLFLGPVVQTSSANSQTYLPDTIIYSQNGTPYYTASFAYTSATVNFVPSPTIVYHPLLVPPIQPAQPTFLQGSQPTAFWEDQPGFGGFVQAGTQSAITTVSPNEDVLIVGFKNRQTRLVYTSNDIVPFNFYTINSELGSESTFSSIILDRGVISVGGRGIIITSQTASQRIDLPIPDQVFQIQLTGNGSSRVTAQRDYINEWIYFTYNSNESAGDFPDQTLLYNYRDDTWAIFNETYTTYGTFQPQTGYTWATIGLKYPSWSAWTDPWDAGETTLLQPQTIGGNAQGFIMFMADGTGEGNSEYIKSISGSTITSPGHGLNDNDYILISGALGTIGTQINGNIFSVNVIDNDTFTVNPTLTSGTYLGLGVFKRMYIPFIQTRQFPVSWQSARKTRIGVQQYLLTTTANGQITLLIFLSQNASEAYNSPNESNNSLIYSSVLYTCPESTNLGLTPANINLQMITAQQQSQIWHRMNTSLLGDTVQIGFTMSDEQMRDPDLKNQFSEIELHGFLLDVSPSQVLA